MERNARSIIKKELRSLRSITQVVKDHKFNKVKQNESYEEIVDKVTATDAVVIMDYKENIELLIGPDEVFYLFITYRIQRNFFTVHNALYLV